VGDTNNAIRRIGTNGIVSTVAGSLGSGFADGTGSVAQFSSIRGLAVNPQGTVIYVSDQGNHRVRRVFNNISSVPENPDSWYVSTIAGTGAVGGAYSSARGNVATFNAPFGMARAEGDDALYMTENSGNRVRRLRF